MSLPMLQVALDNQTLASAYETTRLIAEEVDIIEVGTILCVGEGVRAVRDLKALYPHKIVLADAKIADAGKILSRMCFEANADWVTVTGGLALEDLPLFAGIPIHVFIAGRSIRDAASPVEAARQFKRSIAQLWG